MSDTYVVAMSSARREFDDLLGSLGTAPQLSMDVYADFCRGVDSDSTDNLWDYTLADGGASGGISPRLVAIISLCLRPSPTRLPSLPLDRPTTINMIQERMGW